MADHSEEEQGQGLLQRHEQRLGHGQLQGLCSLQGVGFFVTLWTMELQGIYCI
jgi:hypothetical protein